jgi:DnaJ-class molecular chaperone
MRCCRTRKSAPDSTAARSTRRAPSGRRSGASTRISGGAAGQQRYQPHNEFGDEDLADLFTRAFGKRGRSGFAAKGEDRHYTLSVNFLEAARGATKRISLPDGRTLDVAIPEGHP